MSQEVIKGTLVNAVVKGRYVIIKHLDKGSYGTIYKVKDL